MDYLTPNWGLYFPSLNWINESVYSLITGIYTLTSNIFNECYTMISTIATSTGNIAVILIKGCLSITSIIFNTIPTIAITIKDTAKFILYLPYETYRNWNTNNNYGPPPGGSGAQAIPVSDDNNSETALPDDNITLAGPSNTSNTEVNTGIPTPTSTGSQSTNNDTITNDSLRDLWEIAVANQVFQDKAPVDTSNAITSFDLLDIFTN